MAIDQDAKLGLALRFEVTLDQQSLGSWAKVDGLDIKWDLCEYREGSKGSNTRYYVPGIAHYTNVKMTRGLSPDTAGKVGKWLKETCFSHKKGTGKITLFDAWQTKVFEWELRGVIPVHWTGPVFDADAGKVATESLEIAHEGWLE